jgi:hypothetical protein
MTPYRSGDYRNPENRSKKAYRAIGTLSAYCIIMTDFWEATGGRPVSSDRNG